jgi:hypothetical protein
MRQMMMALALLGAVTTGAYAQTSTAAKPKAKSTTTSSTKPAAAASHSVSGTVKAMDANMLTVTPSGKDKSDLMVMMNTSTTKEGALAVGSKVSVHYKEENGQKIATSVKASAAKPASSGKKK